MVKMKKANQNIKTVEVDNIINNTNPIWTKAPAELKDEDYLIFTASYILFPKSRCSGST